MRGVLMLGSRQISQHEVSAGIAGLALSALLIMMLAGTPALAEDREAAQAVDKVAGSVTAWQKKKERCSGILKAGNQRVAKIHDSDKPEDQATVKAERKKGLTCLNDVLKEGDRIAETLEAALQKVVQANENGELGEETLKLSLFIRGTFCAEFTDEIFNSDLDGYLLIGSRATKSIDGAYLPRNYNCENVESDLPIRRS